MTVDDADLENRWKMAMTTWTTIHVPFDVYSSFVRERTSTGQTDGHVEPRWDDLYLACACAAGNTRAIAVFEQAYFGEVRSVLSRLGKRAPPLDEALQLLRQRLFVGPRPRIAEYSGRGDLKAWLKVVTLRLALNATARKSEEVSLEEHAFGFLAGEPDPEIEYMKQLYRAEFVAAFGEAARELDDEDRSLLHQAFLEGLTVDAIGELHGVHRATAARWVRRAHERLVRGVHTAFRRRLAVAGNDYESILRLIESRLELSLASFLGPPAPSGDEDEPSRPRE